MVTEYTGEVIPAKEYTGEVVPMTTPVPAAPRTPMQMLPATQPSFVQRAFGALNRPTQMPLEMLDLLNRIVTRGAYKAGGVVTDIAAKTGASPELSAGLGVGTDVAIQSAPVVLSGFVGRLFSPVMETAGRKLMQSALKPPLKALQSGKAAEAIQTMLDEGISVSSGGVEKLKSKIKTLNDAITSAIKSSPATVNKKKVAEALRQPLMRFAKQVNPDADINALRSAWNQFMNHPLLTGKDEIPVQLAQEMKQATYGQLAKKYGELGTAETEGQKALARGLKEGVAKAVPTISRLNEQESKLINALSLAERRALMAANRDPVGIVWLSHNPATWAAYMADKSNLFKSLLGRMMFSGAKPIPGTAAELGTAGVITAQPNQ